MHPPAIVAPAAANVLLLYAPSLGSVGPHELERHLLTTVIPLGLRHALQRGDNVRVDLFDAGFGPRATFVVDVLPDLLKLLVAPPWVDALFAAPVAPGRAAGGVIIVFPLGPGLLTSRLMPAILLVVAVLGSIAGGVAAPVD